MGEPNRALIVVDVQNAFVVPSAGAPVEDAHQVVEAVNRCVSEAVDRGWPVFYTQDIAPFDAPAQELAQQVELYPGLDVRGTVVRKGPGRLQNFSSFLLASDHVPDGGGPGGGA